MSEIMNSVKLKNKITIISVLVGFAVILAVVIGILGNLTADRHNHIYDYNLRLEEDGSFSLVGLCNVENCESPYFLKENLEGVNVVSAVSPTCSNEGVKKYTYTYGDITLKYDETLEKTAHLYDYELVTSNGIVYINGKSRAEGCTDPYLFINNITEIKLISVVEGTCFSPRQETFAFVADGRSGTLVTLVDENIPHTLNGLPCDQFTNVKGEFKIGTPGVKLLKNGTLACGAVADGYYVCEVCRQVEVVRVYRPDHEFVYGEGDVIRPNVENATGGKVTLHCKNEECTETTEEGLPAVEIGKNAFVISDATERHPKIVKYSYESIIYGFTIELEFEIGDPLSHHYKYTLEPSRSSSGGLDVIGKCNQPECVAPEIVAESNVACDNKNTSTCVTLVQEIWSYNYNGQLLTFALPSSSYADHVYDNGTETKAPGCVTKGEITFACTASGCSNSYTEPVSATGHHYDYITTGVQNPTDESTGLVALSCTGCDDEFLYELPKVVFGEGGNSKVLYEGTTLIFLEYTHKTEYGCTIVLELTIYK